MEFDIKEKIEEIVKKITGNKDLLAKFKKDPIKTIEGIIGIDLPDEQLKGLVEGIKAKISLNDISEKVGGVSELLGGLFGKK